MYEGLIGTFGVLKNRVHSWYATGGVVLAVRNLTVLVLKVLATPFFVVTRSRKTFTFRGKAYRYFVHWYNTTFDNERCVEVAISGEMLRQAQGKHVLEVGNVLSHYLTFPHDILDKYEKAAGVTNEDVVSFEPKRTYDLIVSVSTMEHVGFDEHVRDPHKFRPAVKNLHACLAPGGTMMITVPVGYNTHIHEELRVGDLFQEVYYMHRVSRSNRWVECDAETAFAHRFNDPYPFANAIVIAFFHKPA